MRMTTAALLGAAILLGCAERSNAQGLMSARTYAGSTAPTFHYSYYFAPGLPAREYVGPPEFPFYGKPYGHPNDRWSWGALSGGYQGTLSRYYYAPVR